MASMGSKFGRGHPGGRSGSSAAGSSSDSSTGGSSSFRRLPAAPPALGQFVGGAAPSSTCVEPDHRELIRSVGTVLHRRVRDNETSDTKITMPLFCEDTHTEPEPEDRYDVTLPLLHLQSALCPALYTLSLLPPPPKEERSYEVPSAHAIAQFIENIRQKARLTPQALVITLIYVDRMEARAMGVLLHARSWRPIVFASLLLASKVWHDISYWNSDFSSICPMFHVRNINRMERSMLQLLQYNTMVAPSQYASYYFSLRHAVRAPEPGGAAGPEPVGSGGSAPGQDNDELGLGSTPTAASAADNFRSKYFMQINIGGSSKLAEQTALHGKGSERVEAATADWSSSMAGHPTSGSRPASRNAAGERPSSRAAAPAGNERASPTKEISKPMATGDFGEMDGEDSAHGSGSSRSSRPTIYSTSL